MSATPTFPLPKGYFGPVRLTAIDQMRFRDMADAEINTALLEERELSLRGRQVDYSKWKLRKQRRDMRIYRRRSGSVDTYTNQTTNRKPSMMGCGRFEGTIEDVIYGTYAKNHDEFKMLIGFMGMSAKDCTVLQTLETSTRDDPFHYLGLKWMLTGLPIVKQRDWCYLEGMGIQRDSEGRRYGYILTHSVNLFNCPPFPRKIAVRGQVFFTYILRENVQGCVDVYARGLYDPAGELVKQFSVVATSLVFFNLPRATEMAEAKKLTLHLMDNMSLRDDRSIGSQCNVCKHRAGMFSKLKSCRICNVTVCVRCSVKKNTLAGPQLTLSNIRCCAKCIMLSSHIKIRPVEETWFIPSCYVVSNGGSERTDSVYTNDVTTSDSIMDVQSDDGRRSMMSGISGVSEREVENILGHSRGQTIEEDTEYAIGNDKMAAPSPKPFSRQATGGGAGITSQALAAWDSASRRGAAAGPAMVPPSPIGSDRLSSQFQNSVPYSPASARHMGYNYTVPPSPVSASGQIVQYQFGSSLSQPPETKAPAPSSRQQQQMLFHQMVALEQASMQVYEMTRMNGQQITASSSTHGSHSL